MNIIQAMLIDAGTFPGGDGDAPPRLQRTREEVLDTDVSNRLGRVPAIFDPLLLSHIAPFSPSIIAAARQLSGAPTATPPVSRIFDSTIRPNVHVVVIYLDQQVQSQHIERRMSDASQQSVGPLSVYLLIGRPYPSMYQMDERATVISIMKLLFPYLPRIHSLFIETNQSSSLPPLWLLLATRSVGILKHLAVVYHADDSGIGPFSSLTDADADAHYTGLLSSAPNARALCHRLLTELIIGGGQLIQLFDENSPDNLARLFPILECITIYHLTPRAKGYSPAIINSLSPFLDHLQNLRTALLQHTAITRVLPARLWQQKRSFRPSVGYAFINCNADTIEIILGSLTTVPSEVMLRGCSFYRQAILPPIPTLIISDVDIPNTSQLASSVATWEGTNLVLAHFKSDFDQFMTQISAYIHQHPLHLQNLRHLSIRSCTGFTSAGAIKLLFTRMVGQAGGDVSRWETPVDVLQCMVCSPLEKDEEAVLRLVAQDVVWTLEEKPGQLVRLGFENASLLG